MTVAQNPGRRRSLVAAGTIAALLGGCAVGPNFEPPPPPEVKGYTAQPVSVTASTDVPGGEEQRFLHDLDIPGQWWTLFKSEPLTGLIERAFAANPDVAAAQSALRVALENVYAQQGAFYPSIDAGVTGTRERSSANLSPVPANGSPIFNLFTGQVNVSYTPDVFGLIRRSVEALQAQAEGQKFQVQATYITLASNVVTAAIQEAALRDQIAATQDIIKAETDLVDLFRRQLALGQVAGLDVAAQEAALAAAQATLPPLEKQLGVQRDLLAALAGGFAADDEAPKFELSSLTLPRDLPLSLPSTLVERRPDIRQAEANLHAASAQIGVAVANRLPNITLSANAGKTALGIGSLFGPGAAFWTLTGSVTQPIFQGGTLLHRERAARAAFDQAAAQYRSAVISAFQNVADTLNALQSDANALKAAVAAERAAQTSFDITRRQVELGAANYVALLTAQQTYLNAVITVAQARGNRFADTAALFQALGGGWWNRRDDATGGGEPLRRAAAG
jgi:NodT family efflux transporter outer membrane factor (OMF) lipoprotein